MNATAARHAASVNPPAYMRAINVAIRSRSPGSNIRHDPEAGTWTCGVREVRAVATGGGEVRFELYLMTVPERFVGRYSGRAGAPIQELVEYLVHFLETGKPWHRGLPKRGLA